MAIRRGGELALVCCVPEVRRRGRAAPVARGGLGEAMRTRAEGRLAWVDEDRLGQRLPLREKGQWGLKGRGSV